MLVLLMGTTSHASVAMSMLLAPMVSHTMTDPVMWIMLAEDFSGMITASIAN